MEIVKNKLRLSLGEVKDIYFEDGNVVEIIEKGDWIDNDKYDFCSVIIKYANKFYEVVIGRSGDHWSGYDYDWDISSEDSIEEYDEVEKVEVIKYEWKNVSK